MLEILNILHLDKILEGNLGGNLGRKIRKKV
jgi:hypothetical protein